MARTGARLHGVDSVPTTATPSTAPSV